MADSETVESPLWTFSKEDPEEDTIASPFLRLPFELRLAIYEYLLFPSSKPSSNASTSVATLSPDAHTDTNTDPFVLCVRTIVPDPSSKTTKTWHRRTTYYIQNQTGSFHTSTTCTTYHVLPTPWTAHLSLTVLPLLLLNRQIHAEAAAILYSAYTFNFGTHIEAAVPFLGDLTPLARSHVRNLQLTKKALPMTKEFDRAEWGELCGFLEQCVEGLRGLELGVVVGRREETDDEARSRRGSTSTSDNGKEKEGGKEKSISKEEFEVLRRLQREWKASIGGVDLEWVEQLMRVRGLSDMKVRALAEGCGGAGGDEGRRFWNAFCRSVEGGFAEWVSGVMMGEKRQRRRASNP